MRDAAQSCSLCAEKRPVVVRLFRYCPECGTEFERPAPRAVTVPEAERPGRDDPRPETTGWVERTSAVENETPGEIVPKTHPGAGPMRSAAAVVMVVSVAALLVVVAIVWSSGLFGPSTAERRIEVVARRGEWTPVRLADAVGKGRAFTVAGDGPIRVRTGDGRPMIVEGPPLSLGDLADGSLEIRAVDRETTVTFLAR